MDADDHKDFALLRVEEDATAALPTAEGDDRVVRPQ
jgi:hypothetical protein